MRVSSPAEAAALLRPRDTLGLPLGPGIPGGFVHALGARDDFEQLVVSCGLLVDWFELFTRKGVRLLSGFFGPVERMLREGGHDVHYVPADFRRFAVILEQSPPRVMATTATPPDADGRLSLSLHAGATVSELRHCGRDPDRVLVVEANARLPRTLGLPPTYPHTLHVDEIDVLVESDRPPFEIADPPPGDVDRAIAAHALHYLHDGCTLQTGIGAVPSLIACRLAEGSGGDYGIHSEMFTTGLMRLHQAGKVTNRKGVYEGVSVCTFAAGTKELYAWLDGQDAVRFLPVEAVNDPDLIVRNRNMVSINGALAVDLAGQVAADTIDGRQHSGTGGHEDFVGATGTSLSDRSLVCLPSTATLKDGRRLSRIVASFDREMLVTTPRHQVDVVVTEHGAAELRGRTVDERVEALVAVAAPEFREELRGANRFR
jgi:acyl-CoA hydrolase